MRYYVVVTWTREGLHYWAEAPPVVGFLRDPHRHLFHFKVKVEVGHTDRELEIIQLKRQLQAWSENLLPTHSAVPTSCEEMAKQTFDDLFERGYNPLSVEVWEDGENGGGVEVTS